MGRGPNDGRLAADVKAIPHAHLDDRGAFFKVNGEKLRPEEVAAFLLAYILRAVNVRFDTTISRLVLTVPVYFNTSQKEATRNAARMAGYGDVTLVEEPVAAAVAYVSDQSTRSASYLLVVDIGGGTTDVTLVHSTVEHPQAFLVKATAGNNCLGGIDLDRALVQHAKEKVNNADYEIDLVKLQMECETRKKEMSDPRKQEASITAYGSDIQKEPTDVVITRAEFDDLCASTFYEVPGIIDEAVPKGSVDREQVNRIILVGGSCALPFIRNLCAEKFPGIDISLFKPEECVARGAAYIADNPVDIIPILPRTIGIDAHDQSRGELRVTPVIKRNTQLPIERSHTFFTKTDNQDEVLVEISEGEDDEMGNNISLGSFVISGIPDCPAGTEIEVTMAMSKNFELIVTAQIESLSETLTVTPKQELSPEDLQDYTRRTAKRIAGKPVTSNTLCPGDSDLDAREEVSSQGAKASEVETEVEAERSPGVGEQLATQLQEHVSYVQSTSSQGANVAEETPAVPLKKKRGKSGARGNKRRKNGSN